MNYISILNAGLILILLTALPALSQQKDSSNIINFYALETDMTIPSAPEAIDAGQQLFALECAECHSFCQQSIGPPLASVTERRPLMWLLTFIKNPRNVINQGDPYANHLFENYGNKLMPEFEHLSESEILNILAYIKDQSKSEFDPSSGPPLDEKKVKPQYGEEYATEYYRNDSSTAMAFPMESERIESGKTLFQAHCKTCHSFCSSETGPALSGVTERRPLSWLLAFINNPQQVMDEGDSYAKNLHSHFGLVMPSFNFLKEEEVIDILAYIKDESAAPVHVAGSVSTQNNPDTSKPMSEDARQDDYRTTEPGRHWTSIASYSFVVLLTIVVLVFLLRRFWKRL